MNNFENLSPGDQIAYTSEAMRYLGTYISKTYWVVVEVFPETWSYRCINVNPETGKYNHITWLNANYLAQNSKNYEVRRMNYA